MKIKGVFLDRDSLGADLQLSPLLDLPIDWTFYPFTDSEQTFERCHNAEVIVSNKVVLDEELLSKLSKLKHIAVAATGTNNIDKNAAQNAGISVSNIKDYAGSSVAQLVFAVLLELTTHANRYSTAVKQGKWCQSKVFCLFDFPTMELTGKKIALVGYGSLAKSVEYLAKAFGMTVLIAEHKGADSIRTGRVAFEAALQSADVVSLHCPLTEQTKDLISSVEFSQMKASAILINTARGGIVNEAALLQALKNNQIAAAATDVLTQEPPGRTHPMLVDTPDNLIITPHIAWATLEARQRLLAQLIDNIKQHLLD